MEYLLWIWIASIQSLAIALARVVIKSYNILQSSGRAPRRWSGETHHTLATLNRCHDDKICDSAFYIDCQDALIAYCTYIRTYVHTSSNVAIGGLSEMLNIINNIRTHSHEPTYDTSWRGSLCSRASMTMLPQQQGFIIRIKICNKPLLYWSSSRLKVRYRVTEECGTTYVHNPR